MGFAAWWYQWHHGISDVSDKTPMWLAGVFGGVSALSAAGGMYLWYLCYSSRQRKRTAFKQLAHLGMATSASELVYIASWVLYMIGWEHFGVGACRAYMYIWRFLVLWAVEVHVHISIAVLLASCHRGCFFNLFMVALPYLPVLALLFNLPAALMPATIDYGLCHSSKLAEMVFTFVVLAGFITILGASIAIICIINTHASDAVAKRVTRNMFCFMAVFVASFLFKVLQFILEVLFSCPAIVTNIADFCIAMRGLLDVLVFPYLIKQRFQTVRLMNVVFAQADEVTLISRDTAVANRDAEAETQQSERSAEIADMRKWLAEQFSYETPECSREAPARRHSAPSGETSLQTARESS